MGGDGSVQNIVTNPGFEERVPRGAMGPPGWTVNTMGEKDKWSIDEDVKTEGKGSLRLDVDHQCLASQALSLPSLDLTGKKVAIQADVRTEGNVVPVVFLVATYQDLEPNPGGTTVSATVQAMAADSTGEFGAYEASLIPTALLNDIKVMLSAGGEGGRAWFDRIIVEIEP